MLPHMIRLASPVALAALAVELVAQVAARLAK